MNEEDKKAFLEGRSGPEPILRGDLVSEGGNVVTKAEHERREKIRREQEAKAKAEVKKVKRKK